MDSKLSNADRIKNGKTSLHVLVTCDIITPTTRKQLFL